MSAMHDTIARQIAWNRLIAVVEEQAQTLIRIAFSPTVREAGRPLGRRVRSRRGGCWPRR